MIQLASQELLQNFFPSVKSMGLLRLDLPDPIGGGNKSYKLKYHLEACREAKADAILSFGGAFSNHIAALANAGKQNKIPTIGIIRGEELNTDSNAVLRFANESGMQLHFVSRNYYLHKSESETISDLKERFGNVCIVPEGGGGEAGVRGSMEILTDDCAAYNEILLPVGTGTTCAGIIRTALAHQNVTGLAVVAAKDQLERDVSAMLSGEISCTWKLNHDHTLGGYANTNTELSSFIAQMKERFELPLDHVYSGKALFALHRQSIAGSFSRKDVLFIHTGGYAFAG